MKKKETYQDYEPYYDNNDRESTDYLYDWVFHYNIYTELWCAIPRDKYTKYWDDSDLKDVIRSTSFNTLIEILHRTKGDISQLEKKIKIDHE